MTGSDFFAKRATRRQSPTDASSSPLPKLPVSSSLVAVVPRAIIRSPRPQRRKYVVSGPKKVLQHNPLSTADIRAMSYELLGAPLPNCFHFVAFKRSFSL